MSETRTDLVLPKDVEVLKSPETGATRTAHISEQSADDVEQLITIVKPDVVVLELCKARTNVLKPPQSAAPEKMTLSVASDMFKHQGGLSVLIGYLYSNVMPGEEFRRGYQIAQRVGAKILLGDRPVQITLKRTWNALSSYEKLKLIFHVLKESSLSVSSADIESMKNSDVLTEMVKEFSKEFPSLARTLIDERDLYMACVLRKCVGNKIVAVVGKGHVNGIKNNFTQPLPDIAPLIQIQSKPSIWITLFKTALLIAGTTISVKYLIKRLK